MARRRVALRSLDAEVPHLRLPASAGARLWGRLSAAVAFATGPGRRIEAIEQLPTSGLELLSLESLDQLASEMQNLVQLTPPAPVVAVSAEAALDLVFDQLVVDTAGQRYRFKKKHPGSTFDPRGVSRPRDPLRCHRAGRQDLEWRLRRHLRLRRAQRARRAACPVLVVPASQSKTSWLSGSRRGHGSSTSFASGAVWSGRTEASSKCPVRPSRRGVHTAGRGR